MDEECKQLLVEAVESFKPENIDQEAYAELWDLIDQYGMVVDKEKIETMGYKTIEICPEDRIAELEDENQRLRDIIDAVDTKAHEPLRDGGCDADDLANLERACEDIIDLAQQV